MGMGAPKQGSTLPPQGGKGGARPTTNSPLQPGATIFNGVVTPNTIGPNGQPVGGTMPGGKAPGAVQPGQPQSPYTPIGAQGGKGGTSNVPGYAQPYVNALNPQAQQPASGQVPSQLGNLNLGSLLYGNGGGQQPTVQPTLPAQVPAQGGKAPITLPRGVGDVFPTPQVPAQGGGQAATAEQLLALQSQLDATRPMPQAMLQQAAPEQLLALQSQLNATRPMPQRPMPQRPMPQVQQPAPVMPRPVPQVMPRQPAPKPAPMQPQGLAQMQQFLKQQQMLKGRR